MYSNHSTDERTRDSSRSEQEYLRDSSSEQRFVKKWSPQTDIKFIAHHRYCPSLSKSYPRRNKSLQRFRTNRSLNFDSSTLRNEHEFKSPSSGLNQFSRSAKIMRALNFNTCPISAKKRSITKVLNFDISLSPRNSPDTNSSSSFATSSPIMNASSNLSALSSSNESNNSILGNSVESMDENQNRTPSQAKNSVKKALRYSTPRSNSSLHSPSVDMSPGLRRELREKIDSLIVISETPTLPVMRKSMSKLSAPQEVLNTSRNLFHDFQREVEVPFVPSTPKNLNRPIPESMSAIKKSHKKERLSRRLEDSMNECAESVLPNTSTIAVKTERNTAKTPKSNNHSIPNYRMNSIKHSHKKEKNKVNTLIYDSDDDLCETGSIFDGKDKENAESPEKRQVSNEAVEEEEEVQEPGQQDCLETPKWEVCHPDNESNACQGGSSSPMVTRSRAVRPKTPENEMNLLQRLAMSSIKKSHKKIKEENRKKVLKPNILHDTLNMSVDSHDRMEDDRPMTPDCLNSSRLLLDQFDSIKKSHRKEKKNKMLHGFAKRQMHFQKESDSHNSSAVSLALSEASNVEKEFAPLQSFPMTSTDDGASPQKKMKTSNKRPINAEAEEKQESIVDSPPEICVQRCETPISTENFVKSTPKNKSTMELVRDIEHSIKKSHKKDKLAARQKLSSVANQAAESVVDYEDPRPSTSYDASAASTASSDNKETPPQNPMMKNLMLLKHNTSIKRSHKKDRQKRRISLPEEKLDFLRDNGSLFPVEDDISFLQDEDGFKVRDDELTNYEESRSNVLATDPAAEVWNTCDNAETLSDDGSIFNLSERLHNIDDIADTASSL